MNFFRQILILFFATVIFTGTVGVNVFAHYCKIDGVDYSFLAPNDDHCVNEETLDSCCMAKVDLVESDLHMQDDCCSDEVNSFKISSEIFQKEYNENQIVISSHFSPMLIPVIAIQDYETDLHYFNLRQPIPKSGRDLLIQNQIFRL